MLIKNVKRLVKGGLLYPILLYYKKQASKKAVCFEFNTFKEGILNHINSLSSKTQFGYRFTSRSVIPDLYSTTYATMLLGLLGEIDKKNKIILSDYFLSHQCNDGLFRDSNLQSSLAETGHHWGWHHLVPHVIIALDYLEVTPKYDFNGLLEKFNNQSICDWLEKLDWEKEKNYLNTSNIVMNVGVMLQYSRDNFGNKKSEKLVTDLKHWLLENIINPDTLLTGINIDRSKHEISRAVKALYHIVPIFIYDCDEEKLPIEKILYYALKTQNRISGYGPQISTNACEDIDSLYLLTELAKKKTPEITQSIQLFFNYVFLNQNTDNGFNFKTLYPFTYGNQAILSSGKNESNLFATWFRTLSIAFACNYLKIPNEFIFSNVPGYQFKKDIDL